MRKFALMPVLLATGCLAAGLYGALHDQVSYTVSPDYYYSFKFHQFDIPQAWQGRLVRFVVDGRDYWRAGADRRPDPAGLEELLKPLFAGFCGRCGHGAGGGPGGAGLRDLDHHGGVVARLLVSRGGGQQGGIARVGTMHNFGYLGGFLGIITGSLYLVVARLRLASVAKTPALRSDRNEPRQDTAEA